VWGTKKKGTEFVGISAGKGRRQWTAMVQLSLSGRCENQISAEVAGGLLTLSSGEASGHDVRKIRKEGRRES